MWEIYEKKYIQKTLKKLPKETLIRYEAWKRIVELEGPDGLKLVRGFRDETLKGKWKGFRSSRLGIKWRVIYKVQKDYLEVYVFEITPHNY
ncbi:MAG TPA: type II toxin-antitoxin system mRNA interferase toxin, RelE/StbE family [Nitrospinota bacterium]|jgi:addiction module RelE/StbE family toxin|nr:type II toxin-antitoxin system mRNA interferase toxin, RelE/StbE family [Nitrospinota bacterium]|tara:strand:- start:833 stop:1105 length:273 start_codon:yes stop_codon:yes gene_type:complete